MLDPFENKLEFSFEDTVLSSLNFSRNRKNFIQFYSWDIICSIPSKTNSNFS